jgi:hypothetical protein
MIGKRGTQVKSGRSITEVQQPFKVNRRRGFFSGVASRYSEDLGFFVELDFAT